ncbi:ATP-dependent zinc protease [Vibrio zhugei]|uniref:ATP-dependent zinc protease n=1 Tax=Vibrio zhugei TaxID=2479546 RepID=A0ABV7C8J0_9VIBR|nr:ATP-dependent zinc protease [Vibrio zhugei]
MFKRIAPIVALSLLSGCTMMHGDNYHQATLAAIHRSESNVNAHLTNVELQLSNQMDFIDSLQREIQELKNHVDKLENTASKAQSRQFNDTNQDTRNDNLTISEPKPRNKIVLGGIENVSIDAINQSFKARVDTGAATSSLNAVDVQEFERNGKDWVRFHLVKGDDTNAHTPWIEAPIIRHVRIRQANTETPERRAVIKLWVKLGNIHEQTPFTLADRKEMSHAILLGREFIRDIAVVDVSKQFIRSDNTKK